MPTSNPALKSTVLVCREDPVGKALAEELWESEFGTLDHIKPGSAASCLEPKVRSRGRRIIDQLACCTQCLTRGSDSNKIEGEDYP